MRFTPENTNYCLLAFDHWQKSFAEQFTQHKPAITGLYQWVNALGGTMAYPRTAEQFSKFNIIHVNLTPRNFTQLPRIRPLIDRNHTKLVVNVDYSIDLWGNNFVPEDMLHKLDMADHIFAVEPQMASILQMHLRRPVPVIPHPCDLHGVGQFATTERNTVIGVNIHRYDKNILMPWFALNNLKIDRSKYLTMALGGCYKPDEVAHLYDIFAEHEPFPELMKTVARMLFCIDTYTIRSYGRFSIECAALGVPCIGSRLVSSISHCFPELAIETNDIYRMATLAERLTRDDEFYTKVATLAQQRVSYYSHENCKKLFLSMLNEGE